jgi:hypothetical protein
MRACGCGVPVPTPQKMVDMVGMSLQMAEPLLPVLSAKKNATANGNAQGIYNKQKVTWHLMSD